MFFDSFNSFYEKYKDIIQKDNNDNFDVNRDFIKSFWNRHCSKLHYKNEMANSHFIDESNDTGYISFVDKDRILIMPSYKGERNFNPDTNKLILSIGESLKCIEIRDGNIIIESVQLNNKFIYIEIYDQEATSYFYRTTKASLEKIDHIERYIKSEGLLPDKSIKVYGPVADDFYRIYKYKKQEIDNIEVIPNNEILSLSSMLTTKIDIDDLLSDLNKKKVKKINNI